MIPSPGFVVYCSSRMHTALIDVLPIPWRIMHVVKNKMELSLLYAMIKLPSPAETKYLLFSLAVV